MTSFDAQVSAWIARSEKRMEAVFKESAKRVVRAVQVGIPGIPVDTGFARASVRASTDAMPQIDPSLVKPKTPGRIPGSGEIYTDDHTSDIMLVINGMHMGQSLYVGWTANYVVELEKGHSQQAPNGFIRLGAMQWPQIVNEVSAELKGRSGE